ncbi:16.9 kDa class I heat shock protein 1-like [Andrographis paniculata]|uniref:16.9 kDa class I heat shock protein 1-like n=1 Tax=Andrographis paniculata TaxID=175694 RepID=UPI0021E8E3AA|nr:16.9 kDa class I heat shock protein 1-like [Andrographis paniculata]
MPTMLPWLLSDPFFRDALDKSGVSMDWKETPEAHIFTMDLPGVSPADVKLQVHDGSVLHIKADRKEDEGDEKSAHFRWHCRERGGGGSLCREFRLPEDAAVEKIKAAMKDGVMVVTVPKDKKKQQLLNKNQHHVQRRRAVEIGDGGHDGKIGLRRFVCCKAP